MSVPLPSFLLSEFVGISGECGRVFFGCVSGSACCIFSDRLSTKISLLDNGSTLITLKTCPHSESGRENVPTFAENVPRMFSTYV